MNQKLEIGVSGFSDGLNTEASVLNVLPSEMMDGSVNVELLLNGSARRRKGVDFLGQAASGSFMPTLRTGDISTEVFQESPSVLVVRLTAPNGSLVDRVIVDADNSFLIYKVDGDNNGLINVDTPFQNLPRGVQSNTTQVFYNMQMAVSGSKIYFAGLKCNPGYLQVSADNINMEIVYIDVLTRNLSATALNSRVQIAGAWYECIQTHTSDVSTQPGVGANWKTYWFQLEGPIPTVPTIAAWTAATSYPSTIIKTYDKTATSTAASTYPTSVEFFAGRLWLAGDPRNPNAVYFSQVIVNDTQAERFMQFADPQDNNDPNVVDSDGGVISIQGANLGKRLLALAHTIFVGCSNGIWQVLGVGGIFSATSFSIVRTLTDGISGPETMVRIDKDIIVFGDHAIWHGNVESNLTSSFVGLCNFTSVTENRLESFYQAIPQTCKASARCVYNQSDRRVYYFFNKTVTSFDASFNTLNQPGYSKNVLIVDTRFQKGVLEQNNTQSQVKRTLQGAFFLYELADTAHQAKPYIACPFIIPSGTVVAETVTVSGVTVTSSSVVVVADTSSFAGDVVTFFALQRVVSGTAVAINAAFATLVGTTTKDWASAAQFTTSYSSTIITGTQTLGDVLHKKTLMYVFAVMKKVESGTLINGIDTNQGGLFFTPSWQWSINSRSANYGPAQAIYFPDRFGQSFAESSDDGYSTIWRKVRIRGRGNAFQAIFTNDGDKDFHLIGWTQQFFGKND